MAERCTTRSPNLLRTVELVEEHLFDFYHFEVRAQANDHIIQRLELPILVPELSDRLTDQRGSVVTVTEGEEAFLGIYLGDEIVQELENSPCFDSLQRSNLDAFCVVVEEVSHFHLMMNRFTNTQVVSQLELEWQGEVDKVLVSAAVLNDQHKDPHIHQLFKLIYEAHEFLDTDEIDRYREANHQAAVFWRAVLDRFGQPFSARNIADLKSLLRSGYRSNWQGKIAMMNDIKASAA